MITVGKTQHKERDANIYGRNLFTNPGGFLSQRSQDAEWQGNDYLVKPKGIKAFRFHDYRNAAEGDEVEVSRE
jgi:hypothetical protein